MKQMSDVNRFPFVHGNARTRRRRECNACDGRAVGTRQARFLVFKAAAATSFPQLRVPGDIAGGYPGYPRGWASVRFSTTVGVTYSGHGDHGVIPG